MAIDEADGSDDGGFSGEDPSDSTSEEREPDGPVDDSPVRVGEYTWADFMDEHGYGDEVSTLYPHGTDAPEDRLGLDTDAGNSVVPCGDDWDRVSFDPTPHLGYHPDDLGDHLRETMVPNANVLREEFLEYVDPESTPVVKDVWTWEHYKWEYYYEEDGSRPRDGDGEIVRFDGEDALGFDPDEVEGRLSVAEDVATALDELVDERTVNVQEEIDEDEFFSTDRGITTVSNRYDLEKAVPMEKKTYFREVERYWVNKPYAFVVIFHSEKENEKKYYLVEPYSNEIETELTEFLTGKLRTAIKYSEEHVNNPDGDEGRGEVIETETRRLLKRYDLFERTAGSTNAGIIESIKSLLDDDDDDEDDEVQELEGIEVRPEPAILEDDPDTLTEYQVEKLLYLLKRDFIGYERIDGIKHDINVEDVSCDGYNSPVFVYHSEYEQIISNVHHGEDELDDFVVKLAQRSGKGISKRLPQVDATLPDGSRAQLTLGKEVSDHGTNYTIRQFKDVPFTPIDLINWNTFSLDEMAFFWLCIENHKSLIFAGGTASGKTTSLNAVSLFIPSSSKIVSIEDTREVELPQRNWIASVTRPSFSDDAQGDVDEFDLLEAALRQRPDYIVMGEIRGEEGRTLFQVMSTGHTTYTTFHADSVDEVLKRFTTDPINVSKTMFTALDLVSIQTQTRVQGRKVRRNKSLTEINHYEAEHDEINVQDVYQWQAETDEYLKMGESNTLSEIQFDRGWSREKLEEELFKRQAILAYLIKNGLNTYAEVAATVQAFINDSDTILTLIANGQLEDSLADLREMESVLIDVDPEKEELVPRPDATEETYNLSTDILERAEESLFEEYRGAVPSGIASALGGIEMEETIEAEPAETDEGVDGSDAWDFGDFGDDVMTFGFDDAESDDAATDPAGDAIADAGDGATDTASASAESAVDAGSATDAENATDAGSVVDVDVDDEELPALTGEVDASNSTSEAVPASESAPEPAERADEPTSAEVETEASTDESGLDGLFQDMGSTLEELERTASESADEPDEPDEEEEFDVTFADEEEAGSLFEPATPEADSADEPADPDEAGSAEAGSAEPGSDAGGPDVGDGPSGAGNDDGHGDRSTGGAAAETDPDASEEPPVTPDETGPDVAAESPDTREERTVDAGGESGPETLDDEESDPEDEPGPGSEETASATADEPDDATDGVDPDTVDSADAVDEADTDAVDEADTDAVDEAEPTESTPKITLNVPTPDELGADERNADDEGAADSTDGNPSEDDTGGGERTNSAFDAGNEPDRQSTDIDPDGPSERSGVEADADGRRDESTPENGDEPSSVREDERVLEHEDEWTWEEESVPKSEDGSASKSDDRSTPESAEESIFSDEAEGVSPSDETTDDDDGASAVTADEGTKAGSDEEGDDDGFGASPFESARSEADSSGSIVEGAEDDESTDERTDEEER